MGGYAVIKAYWSRQLKIKDRTWSWKYMSRENVRKNLQWEFLTLRRKQEDGRREVLHEGLIIPTRSDGVQQIHTGTVNAV